MAHCFFNLCPMCLHMTSALAQGKQSVYFRQFKMGTLRPLTFYSAELFKKSVCNSSEIIETTVKQYLCNYMFYIIV